MKGYIYYSKEESVRNYKFIEDLISQAVIIDIELQLIVDEEQPNPDADFILFRDRNPEKAKSFEQQGFRVINRAEVNRIANDKWLTYELAILLGIPTVPTKLVTMVEDLSQYPIVLKTVDGHGGTEVELCKDSFEASKFITAHKLRKIIAQPYIETSAQDVRVFVIGEEVFGAVKRTGNGSFKSNYTLGGSIEKYTLSSWQEKEAITIARALKSDYIGIDFLLLPDGRWLLNEIEDPVGARSLYATHDVSVAERLVNFIKIRFSSY
ncbi:ATP-grasp domain-containing protein [Sporosarcina sp. G11-34]|uniref:ATP-grasp domain-containing protein n=1 Tax=Sporosarcina sp. G11-34 TaxID=2849605 RepID=UPI0022A9E824|nr:ATP-grasp domain-containing protein [Sporosarcina sp. G11-34]MCZ2259813.1 ATP-grasp domain-containing protein [Sporosarcina sp. G11-34]